MCESEMDILWRIRWSYSNSGICVLHTYRQPTCSLPMLQTLLRGRINAALTGSMTDLSTHIIHERDGDRWLLQFLSINFIWPLPHLLYEHHICTKHVAQSVCGCYRFCAHSNKITVRTSSLVHFLSTVAIFQVTPCHQHISCTSDNTCHLVQGADTNVWQNSSLLQPSVFQEYKWETYRLAYAPHINMASTHTGRYN
jgi:hypothetical protein